AVRIIERRRLDQAGEQARLRGVEPSRGNAEVALARRLDPVGVLAEIGAVQVRAEDLSLRIPVLELPRDRGVLQLAPRVVVVATQIQDLRDLLGDRARPLSERE